MRILLDTSVLVAAMVEAHPMHRMALPCLRRVKDGTDRGFVSAHSLAELYAILTRLPVRPRIPSVVARRLIEENVISSCEVVSLQIRSPRHGPYREAELLPPCMGDSTA